MTPKEKAEYLVSLYRKIYYINDFFDTEYETLSHKAAKQCALIAVDLRISAYTIIPVGTIAWAGENESYWQQVKTEIEKL